MIGVVGTLVPLGSGIVFAVLSLRLGIGSITNPGPGLWPCVVSVALSIFSCILLIHSRLRVVNSSIHLRNSLPKPVLALLLILAYAVVLDTLGFVLSTFLLLAIWGRMISRMPWTSTLALSFLVAVISYVIFGYWLAVPLPSLNF